MATKADKDPIARVCDYTSVRADRARQLRETSRILQPIRSTCAVTGSGHPESEAQERGAHGTRFGDGWHAWLTYGSPDSAMAACSVSNGIGTGASACARAPAFFGLLAIQHHDRGGAGTFAALSCSGFLDIPFRKQRRMNGGLGNGADKDAIGGPVQQASRDGVGPDRGAGRQGEKDKDPAKWRRPASKGGAQSSNAPPPRRRFQPKRSSEKSLEGLCWMMGKILLQHEGQMGIERSEHNLIMLFSRDGTDGTVHHTVPAEELGLSLRACLFSTLLEELLLSQDASDALVCEVRDHWETWPLDLAVPSCAFACDLNRFCLRDHFPIKDERILQEGYVYFYQRYASAIDLVEALVNCQGKVELDIERPTAIEVEVTRRGRKLGLMVAPSKLNLGLVVRGIEDSGAIARQTRTDGVDYVKASDRLVAIDGHFLTPSALVEGP
ncbi:hypothetical protein AK812_SmicGene29432 [Symbiodinium microadriaticum]|uniref:PDZ domain-containing protein n=1 Tax=Symbiodinium microadriaticum TaxID=2951 RepID=A0A1Q9D1S8_SYMMI|nr:hypothetical protein AK812_SmicGene29432 [Symbiodinium microadriaticum]